MKMDYNTKIIAKRTVIHWNGQTKYIAGKEYRIGGLGENYISMFTELYKVNESFYITEPNTHHCCIGKFSDHFTTLKEERKLKLNKLNERRY